MRDCHVDEASGRGLDMRPGNHSREQLGWDGARWATVQGQRQTGRRYWLDQKMRSLPACRVWTVDREPVTQPGVGCWSREKRTQWSLV